MGGYGAINVVGGGYSQKAAGFFASMSNGSNAIQKRVSGNAEYEASIDPRIKAVVAFAPWGMTLGVWDTDGLAGIKVPSFFIAGSHDDISGYENGKFLTPTILENVALDKELIQTEIFGPVMSLISMNNIDDALKFINSGNYGNMACLFTSSGASARKFRNQANAGNIGINIGVAAPMAQFPFSGWKDSFFGDLHGQGKHAIEFFTQTKVIIERWPKEWSRKF
jgi:hypothetical protein